MLNQMLNSSEIKFDGIKYDTNKHLLSAGSQSVYLRAKLNDVLMYMLKNNNRLVSRDELIENVWKGNQYTGVYGVTHSVCQIRKTLAEMGAKNVTISTVPKQGYCLRLSSL